MIKNSKVIFIFGCILITFSLAFMFLLQAQTKQAERTNVEIIQTMENVLINHRDGFKDPELETEMPVLEIQGEDFIALLEIPSYRKKWPVCGIWDKGKVTLYPCRFCGTSYNGNLIIGGYDQPGQFDFFDTISTGVTVTVTDMTGCKFSYVVDFVEHSTSAEAEVLIDAGADLTLFVRDVRLLEYIILRCVMK